MKNQGSWIELFKTKESKPQKRLTFLEAVGVVSSLPAKKAPPSGGFDTPNWFWAAKTSPDPVTPPTDDNKTPVTAPVDPETEIRQMILDNPAISAATLLNMIKSKGYTINCPPPAEQLAAEADSASGQGASILGGPTDGAAKSLPEKPKESNRKLIEFNYTMRESTIQDGVGPTKFKTIMLQEGLGNLKDSYYYTKEALASAVTLFEGKKMYADHPDAIEEQTRPERSVRDIVGHFENIKIEEDGDGRTNLVGDLCMVPDASFGWARALVRRAIELGTKFPDKEFVGLSINAGGEAEEIPMQEFLKTTVIPQSVMPKIKIAMEAGIQTVRVVRNLTEAVSCDMVTSPGAGGKPVSIIESNK